MRKFVRESKFRHVFGQGSPKDQLFDGVVASNSRLDGNICAVNRKFIAVVLVSSGAGVFTVLRQDRPGRVEKYYRFVGHTSEVVDLNFDKFNPCRIASGADDGSVIVWWIPEGGMTDDINEYQCQLKASQRRIVQIEWHPCAENILIGVNIDGINIFNVSTAECIRTIDTSSMSDQIFNFSLNYNGTKGVASFKDKKVRCFDLMTGDKKAEFNTHEGTKPIKLAWLCRLFNDDLIVTTGATRMSERQISVWSLSNTSQPLTVETLDTASAPLSVIYDVDTKLIVFYGKGESSIKMFEFDMEPEPKLHNVASYSAQEAHRAVAFGNKLSCNFMMNEVLHAIRVLPRALEIVQFIVPRKSDQFQDDLFPDSLSESPDMTADDFISGKVMDPKLVSLKTYVFPDGSTPILTKAVTSGDKKTGGASGAARSALTIYDLQAEVNELKETVADLTKRIQKLEK